MPALQISLIAGALGLAVLDWTAIVRGSVALERFAKPAVMVALIACVVSAGPVAAPSRSTALDTLTTFPDPAVVAWALLLAALLGSLAGDVLLLPPVRFVAGLVAFLGAQLAYLGRFLLEGPSPAGALIGLALAGVVLVVAGRRILARATAAGLRVPIAVYLAAICAMAIAATASGRPIAALGAWLFVSSDSILGWDRFVRAAGDPVASGATDPASPAADIRWRLAVIVPYHLGQVLLVLGLIGARLP